MSEVKKSADTSSLAEVIDRILDKGIVIDAYVRVSVVGIEILTVEARVVIASVDTWLRYAEAVGLLRDDIQENGVSEQLNQSLGLENNSQNNNNKEGLTKEEIENANSSKEKVESQSKTKRSNTKRSKAKEEEEEKEPEFEV